MGKKNPEFILINMFRPTYMPNLVTLTKFENDPWKIMDVRVLTGLVCPAARPPARGSGVKTARMANDRDQTNANYCGSDSSI